MQANNYYDQLRVYLTGVYRGYFIGAMIATIIVFVATCLIYEDNDAKCWYLIIPFYNLYTKFKIFWNKNYFFVHLALSIIVFISVLMVSVAGISLAFTIGENINNQYSGMQIPQIAEIAPSLINIIAVGLIISFILLTVIGILEIILEYHLSKTYDYDGLFTVGLLLLPVVFYTILGVKCIKSGVLNRIPTGRKVFIAVCVVLLIALTVLPVYLRLI